MTEGRLRKILAFHDLQLQVASIQQVQMTARAVPVVGERNTAERSVLRVQPGRTLVRLEARVAGRLEDLFVLPVVGKR